MWNIDTPEGMAAAQAWQRCQFELLADKATWGVPMAATVYQIDKKQRIVWRLTGVGDRAAERVIQAIGWQIRSGPPCELQHQGI